MRAAMALILAVGALLIAATVWAHAWTNRRDKTDDTTETTA